MFRNIKILLIALAVIAVVGGTYAFADANTIAPSAAGYATSTVSGYDVTAIVYDLNASDPTLVDKITFTVAPTSGSVVAALVKVKTSAGGTWKDCTLVAGTPPAMSVTCTYTSPTLALADITALNVVASSTTDPAPE